jgi:ATP-dependent RNA helicase SUPV3L1/SUV3
VPDSALSLSDHGRIWWDGAVVGQLEAGSSMLAPRIVLAADEQLRVDIRNRLNLRLAQWLDTYLHDRLTVLFALRDAVEARPNTERVLPAAARGLAYQLFEQLGAVDRERVSLPADERPLVRALRPFGITFGRHAIFNPRLLRPDSARLLALLWSSASGLKAIPRLPAAGITSFADDGTVPHGLWAAAGFKRIGARFIRRDILERLERTLEDAAAVGLSAQATIPRLTSLLGCDRKDLADVLDGLGWRQVDVTAGEPVWRRRSGHHAPPSSAFGKRTHGRSSDLRDTDSPFAGLQVLLAAD